MNSLQQRLDTRSRVIKRIRGYPLHLNCLLFFITSSEFLMRLSLKSPSNIYLTCRLITASLSIGHYPLMFMKQNRTDFR